MEKKSLSKKLSNGLNIKKEKMNLLQIIFNPREAYKKIEENSHWVTDFIIVSFLLVIAAFFMLPFTQKVINNIEVVKNLSANQTEMIKSTTQKLQYFGLLAEPITYIIKSLVIASLLYLGTLIFHGRNEFKKLFALTICSSIIIAMSNIANVIILYFEGRDVVKTIYDLFPLSLNNLFKINEIGAPLYQFLTNFNFFEIWFILILIFGVSKISQMNIKKSSLLVISIWLILVAFNVFQAIMSNNALTNMH